MKVLLVQNNQDLSNLWSDFLRRNGVEVVQAATQSEAVDHINFDTFDALILDLVLPDGGAIAISDLATYRQPDVPIIAVTSTSFFSDGSIFELIPNARSLMRTSLRPDDLVAVLDHYVPEQKDDLKRLKG